MFKVLLAAHLFLGGQLVQPSIATGVPEVAFDSMAECEAKVQDAEFQQIIAEMFQDFLAGKVPAGIPMAIVGNCMPAEEADAAVPLGEPT